MKHTDDDPIEKEVRTLETDGGNLIQTLKKEVEDTVDPIRKTAFQRFPVLFLLLGVFGAVCVLYGFERIVSRVPLLEEYPWLTVLIGIVVLSFTGKLYKKLS